MEKALTKELFEFIENSPSCFHAINNIKTILDKNDFHQLMEGEKWTIEPNKKYYTTRNNSSIIAFEVPATDYKGFNMVASHSDSPTFKIKENNSIAVDNKYTKLNVEKYGGMLYAPWFDRPLSVAGRVIYKNNNALSTSLVNIDRDLVMIPNLSIHMNRDANKGYTYNAQVDMLPLYSGSNGENSLKTLIAQSANLSADDIISSDLFLYNRTKPTIWGANNEFISASRLDDLQCVFASLKAFVTSGSSNNIKVYCVFDNEEVGSGTKQGADSDFLRNTLYRVNNSLGKDTEHFLISLASSFMVSADNAHSVHPNKPELSDKTNRVYMNDGIVIKHNANQKYATDSVSSAIFKTICENANIPYQNFANRSDMAGGSTLGNISSVQLAVNTIDVGLAQLAMHSPYETAGIKDTLYLTNALKEFYKSTIKCNSDGNYTISY